MFEGMQAVADQRGWKLEPPHPGILSLYSVVSLTGSDSGVPIRLERTAASQGFTTLAFLDPPLPVRFAITHAGLAAHFAHLVGFHGVETGDPEFDRSFHVVSKDPSAVTRLLTPDVKDLLRRLSDHTNPLGLRGFHVSEHGVSLSRVTAPHVMAPEELLYDVPLAVAVVLALRSAG